MGVPYPTTNAQNLPQSTEAAKSSKRQTPNMPKHKNLPPPPFLNPISPHPPSRCHATLSTFSPLQTVRESESRAHLQLRVRERQATPLRALVPHCSYDLVLGPKAAAADPEDDADEVKRGREQHGGLQLLPPGPDLWAALAEGLGPVQDLGGRREKRQPTSYPGIMPMQRSAIKREPVSL